MFTIKHIDALGCESLWTATEPHFANGVFTSRQNGETLFANNGGTIYVMNDKGSTVATYHLVDRDFTNPNLAQTSSFNEQQNSSYQSNYGMQRASQSPAGKF